ncbi:hypothetical protein SAMN04487770_1129 [Butyrivibrio sp. ob235]|uniref:DUF5688 family protein n=1 Tax=Butyrivibrio sp. ob235 TaxID=1761780 RepID=UPI0008AEFD53|nr:DUF5688 family protein [Butyrivibrio sp. ob235]SEL53547.1 hypothetical protein SAMN04487770_1129 [Butyrivibrio sp. ob235]
MIYIDFLKECTKKLIEKYEIDGWQVKLFEDGDSADNQADISFIHDTNLKYNGCKDNTIIGDFFRLTKSVKGDKALVCRLEGKYLFDEFENKGWDWIYEIVDSNISFSKKAVNPIDNLENFEKVKDELIIRPLNYEKNKVFLEDKVYRMVGDFVLVLYVLVSETKDKITSVKVPFSCVEKWGMEDRIDDIFDKALSNSSIRYPIRMIRTIVNDIEFGMSAGYMDIEESVTRIDDDDTLVCTCNNGPNGSVSLFYPGIMKRISDLYGGSDYYVAFTAAAEYHVHRCSAMEPETIKHSLDLCNREYPDEMLSLTVYRYSRESGELLPLQL